MTDPCNCPDEAGRATCERTVLRPEELVPNSKSCPACGQTGKPVQRQTVKALLLVSLRHIPEADYRFCSTQFCPVVYFTTGGEYSLNVDQLREQVYQKFPDSEDVLICYCFQHKAGDLSHALPEVRTTIVEDIRSGIKAGQCACDIRNPQGSCCLGNVERVIKALDALDGPFP